MLIKFLRRWRRWRPGDLYDYADGAANLLIRRGIAEPVAVTEEPECLVLTGGETLDPPRPKPRKRGRPRKVKAKAS